MSDEIIIIGGGIGGLSAAHQLVRAGFGEVHVYEASDRPGGKARGQMIPSAQEGTFYPGEHGFRFFPHFYRHIVDTMKHTPVAADGTTAWDHVVPSREAGVAYGGHRITIPRPSPLSDPIGFVRLAMDLLRAPRLSVEDAARYAGVLLRFATSCDERRATYDDMTWTRFARAEKFGTDFREIFMQSSRNLSAMRADESSAYTIGTIALQLMFDFEPEEGRKADPLLDGPTDTTWLEPWVAYLRQQGVAFHLEEEATELVVDRGQVAGVRFGSELVTGRYYVCAVPLERMLPLLSDEILALDPSLGSLRELAREARGDMSGVQFFLRRDVPILAGHVNYPATPFALTSISQAQFWNPAPGDRPDGPDELAGVLSVIISDWDTPGTTGKPGRDFQSRDELIAETWRQLCQALGPGVLREEDILYAHLDHNIQLDPFANDSPLLIHPVGQRRMRPDAAREIQNLFLAADYVRTWTDLASMESADEAARRAVRALLSHAGVDESRWPAVWPLSEGGLFDVGKFWDRLLFHGGRPHVMDIPAIALDGLDPFRLLPGDDEPTRRLERFESLSWTDDDAHALQALSLPEDDGRDPGALNGQQLEHLARMLSQPES